MVKNYDNKEGEKKITAHQNSLACLSLNSNGTLLATSSEKGTLIRVYNTADCTLVRE